MHVRRATGKVCSDTPACLSIYSINNVIRVQCKQFFFTIQL